MTETGKINAKNGKQQIDIHETKREEQIMLKGRGENRDGGRGGEGQEVDIIISILTDSQNIR